MRQSITEMTGLTIGLDIGDKYSHYCCLNGPGEVIKRGKIPTRISAMDAFFSTLKSAVVAIEEGGHSRWMALALKKHGHDVLVANPRKLRMIYENDRKSDRVDSEMLGRVARLDPKLLSPIVHRGPQAQADLTVLRSRDMLVRTRSSLVTHVRGVVKSSGGRLPSCSTASFAKKVRQEIPEQYHSSLDPFLKLIETLSENIKDFDRKIAQMAKENYPEAELLQSISGVGPLSSLAFVLTIEDPGRFKDSRTVGAYFGLCPKRKESGQSQPQMRISKAGNEFVRRLLVQCAQYILGPFGAESNLREWGLHLAQRGGKAGKKRALIAVARKLASILHHMWKTGTPFDSEKAARIPEGKKSTA